MNRRHFLGGCLNGAIAAGRAAQTGAPSSGLIESARQAALHALKPSKRDLEHGLELHAGSIVIDAYGFSPRAAVNGDQMRAAIEAGASDIELQDLQEEMSMTPYVTDAAEREEYKNAWSASGVTCIVQNAGEEGQDPLRFLARFTYVTDMLRDVVEKASVPDDIAAVKKRGKHCPYFSGNGIPLTQQWASVEDELRYIRIIFPAWHPHHAPDLQPAKHDWRWLRRSCKRGIERLRQSGDRRNESRGSDRRLRAFRLAGEFGGGQGFPQASGRQPLRLGRREPAHPLQARSK